MDINGKFKPFHINILRLHTDRSDTVSQGGNRDVLAEVRVAIDHEQEETHKSEKRDIPFVLQVERKKTVEDVHLSFDLLPELDTEMKDILKKFPEVFTDILDKIKQTYRLIY